MKRNTLKTLAAVAALGGVAAADTFGGFSGVDHSSVVAFHGFVGEAAACASRRVYYNPTRMPIYEYYCQDNHTIYQFYAKTLAQGKLVPKCPDNPKFKLRKLVSAFAVTKGGKSDDSAAPKPAAPAGDSADATTNTINCFCASARAG